MQATAKSSSPSAASRSASNRGQILMKTMNLKKHGLFFLISISLTGLSHSQTCQWRPEGNAGPGWYDGGGSPCNNTPEQPTEPAVHWASRWGAVANSVTTGRIGTSAGQSNRREAKRTALRQCGNDNGIKDCKVVMTYHDQCSSIAEGTYTSSKEGPATTTVATAVASTTFEAFGLAIKSCEKKATDCKVVHIECSLPEIVQ
jgi:hypothetical protein